MVLQFPMMADYALVRWNGLTLYATHGHIWNEERLPPMCPGTVLLNGHFHLPACRVHEDYLYLNPGSASIPKDDSVGGYLMLEERTFSWRHMTGQTWKKHTVS